MKRFIKYFFLLTCLTLLLPLKTSAATIKHSGKSGDIDWSIDSDGTLLLSGDGCFEEADTVSFSKDKDGNEIILHALKTPWLDYQNEIKSAKVSVKNATSFAGILSDCENLQSVDFTGSDTSKVVNFDCMLYCTAVSDIKSNQLKTIDISMLDTSSAVTMVQMFSGCQNVTQINLSGINTSNVTDMNNMFYNCSKLTTIKGIHKLNTANVTNMSFLFAYCERLKTLKIGNWDTSNVTDFSFLFDGCSNIRKLELKNWDMSKAQNAMRMFCECSNLSGNITLSKSIKSYSEMFYLANDATQKPFIIYYKDKCKKSFARKAAKTGKTSKSILVQPRQQKTTITLQDKTVKYNGKTIKIGSAKVSRKNAKVTYTYYADKALTKVLPKAPKKAGTYYVVATTAETDDYAAGKSNRAVLRIKK